jgi:hypothetical protein
LIVIDVALAVFEPEAVAVHLEKAASPEVSNKTVH